MRNNWQVQNAAGCDDEAVRRIAVDTLVDQSQTVKSGSAGRTLADEMSQMCRQLGYATSENKGEGRTQLEQQVHTGQNGHSWSSRTVVGVIVHF